MIDIRKLNIRLNKSMLKLLIEMFIKNGVTSKTQTIYYSKPLFYTAVNYLKKNKLVKDENVDGKKIYSLTLNGEVFVRMILAFNEIPKPLNDYGIVFI
ncbi:MAG: hypothetical protein QXD79_08245 [Candidatus Methanomethylicia archaeon]